MAGKPKIMSQIKQLLLKKKQGKSKKAIARELEMSKNTVKTYLYRIESTGMSADALLQLAEPELEAKLLAGNPSYKPDAKYYDFKQRLDSYVKELDRTGVNRRLLWREYKQEKPDGYEYTQFCYHLSQHLKAARPTMILSHKAGDKLYIDFAGKKLSYVDRETGEILECQVFVACLPYSDYSFAMAVKTQCLEDFIYALTRCLEAIGGVPQTLVPDNLKAAIIKANNYEPSVNRALEDFANHYNTCVTPTRARKPKDKALVENQVKLIYSRVYAKLRNEQFFDLQSLNKAITDKVREHNQTRMQQKPWCREEKFLSDEKSTLQALPENRFEIKYYKSLKIAQNNHILLSPDNHHYSVPYPYIGQQSEVVFTRNIVKIYIKGKLVASHIRSPKPGYTSKEEHLCSTHRHYKNRSPEYYQRQAQKQSEELYQLVCQIFSQNRYPEQLYRTCDGLLSLARKTEKEKFTKACQIALENQNYSYRFISNILENNMTEFSRPRQLSIRFPEHENIRGASYYS